MKTPVSFLTALSCSGVILIGMSTILKADPWNKKTILTINESIQVPTKVLEPGKYVFKLLDTNYRHVVQISNGDETQVLATVIAIPNERLRPIDKSEFRFWETPAGQPRALRAWFYPGDNFGHEFAYDPPMAAQINAYNKIAVPTTSESVKDIASVKTEQTTIEPPPESSRDVSAQPTESASLSRLDQISEPSQERVQADRGAESSQADLPAELPHTASYYPVLGLGGLLSLGAFALMTKRS